MSEIIFSTAFYKLQLVNSLTGRNFESYYEAQQNVNSKVLILIEKLNLDELKILVEALEN